MESTAVGPPRTNDVQLKLVRGILGVGSASFISLICGSLYALDLLLGELSKDLELEDWQAVTLTSWGFLGYYLNPGGTISDYVGPAVPSLVAAVVLTGGWLALSLVTVSLKWLLWPLVGLSGVAGGSLFVFSLSTALQELRTRPGLAVALVSFFFGLSLAFNDGVFFLYNELSGCSTATADCWRSQARIVALVTLLGLLPPIFVLLGLQYWSCAAPSSVDAVDLFLDPPPSLVGVSKPLPLSIPNPLRDDEYDSNSLALVDDDSGASIRDYLRSYDLPPDAIRESWVQFEASQKSATADFGVRLTWFGVIRNLLSVSFVSLFLASVAATATGVLVLSQASAILGRAGLGSSYWLYATSTLFSVVSACGALLGTAANDLLHSRLGSSRGVQYAAQLAIGGCTLSVLAVLSSSHLATAAMPVSGIAFVALLIALGVAFASSNLTSVIAFEQYGKANFGRFFTFLQLGPAATSLAMPILANRAASMADSYFPVLAAVALFDFLCGGVLLFACKFFYLK